MDVKKHKNKIGAFIVAAVLSVVGYVNLDLPIGDVITVALEPESAEAKDLCARILTAVDEAETVIEGAPEVNPASDPVQ